MPETVVLISMMMSSGMVLAPITCPAVRYFDVSRQQVYLKLGKVLQIKALFDARKDLTGRLQRNSSKLTDEEAEVLTLLPDDNAMSLFSWFGRKQNAENDGTTNTQQNIEMGKGKAQLAAMPQLQLLSQNHKHEDSGIC